MREDVSLEYVMLSKRITDEYGSEWLETVAMTPQGIQPHSEEKEIVCWEWFSDTGDGRSPDTILLVLPNGMVEIVGSIPSSISKHKRMIMEYLEEALTLTVLTAMCMYGYLILIVAV